MVLDATDGADSSDPTEVPDTSDAPSAPGGTTFSDGSVTEEDRRTQIQTSITGGRLGDRVTVRCDAFLTPIAVVIPIQRTT